MALSFHLVKRPDMRKDAAAGSKLFYAQVRSLKKLDFNKLCDLIAVRSTAFIGDVMLVIEGLLSVMEERLEEGDVIQMSRLGNFRMVAGGKGTENEKDFNVSLFNKARIVFSPGTMLNEIRKNAKYEKMDTETVTPPTGGGSDRPEIVFPSESCRKGRFLLSFSGNLSVSLFGRAVSRRRNEPVAGWYATASARFVGRLSAGHENRCWK